MGPTWSRALRTIRGVTWTTPGSHIQPGVAEDDQAQLRRTVQDAEGADVIKIHPLIDGVQLDPLQAQTGHPGQLAPVVGEVGVDAAEGEHACFGKALIDLG